MSRTAGLLALALLALTAASIRAAEPVKLRPLPPITVDDKGAGLKAPEAVAFDGKSLLLVADTGNGRLLRYTVTGDRVTPGLEIRLPELPYPIQVQITSRGEILALDGKLRRIARLAPTGAFAGYVAADDASAVVLRSFKIDREDDLYLLDVSRGRILVLNLQGRVGRQVAFPPGVDSLSDLTVDGSGTIFAIQSVGSRVFTAKKGEPALSALTVGMKDDMAFPTSIASDDRGRLFIADQNGDGIVILGPDGSFRGRQSGTGWKEGLLRYPSGLCLGPSGTLFVADRENNRVQVFAVSE
jgi:sugar lactone lactonase YvrE